MTNKRNIGTVAALGGLTAAVALITALPSARADELGDLRANQELLQRRIDQLAQVPPPGAPPGGPGGPVMAGSFPRSFVVPGTEVSLRVGGQGVGTVVWYMKGSALGGALNGQGSFNETFVDGQGGTGNLPGIPLNTHTFSAGPGAPVGFAHSRSSEWDFSGKQSRIFLDARTPSPYGEVKAYIEFDFAASNPSPNFAGPFGTFFTDTNQIPTAASCAALTTPAINGTATGTATIGGTTVASNITNACLGNAAFFNPSQDLAPNFVARWRIEQPWGHIQAGVQTILYTLNDGMFLNKQ